MFSTTVRICDHSFLPRLIRPGAIVVDLGAYDGDFAHAMIQRFRCKVISVEAVEAICARTPQHPLLETHHLALGGRNQTIRMNLFATRCASALHAGLGVEDASVESVEMVTLGEFLRRAKVDHVDLLKLDIEGAEIDMFNSAHDRDLQSAVQITAEFHDFIYPELAPAVARIRERMSDIGFWVLPFSLDNTDVLFLNKQSEVSAAEVAYMRSFVRYGQGIVRRLRRLAS
ncbi:MAG: FkbM family methyltransferase [Acidobacteriaceae bacterium]